MTNWLLRIREEKNMKQQNVAEEAGITRPYYTMIERGKRRPSPKVAKKIAKALGFPWTFFYE